MNHRLLRCAVACVLALTVVFAEAAPSQNSAVSDAVAGAGQGSAQIAAQSAELAQRVDAIFADMTKPDAPGCSLGVIRDGQLIYSKGYGLAFIEHGLVNTPRTVFDIGSVSKHFTAAAIVLLAQQGKLSLDDEVRKYVPEMPDYSKAGDRGEGLGVSKPSKSPAKANATANADSSDRQRARGLGMTAEEAGRRMREGNAPRSAVATPKLTIRHLLHHTGGVRNYDTLMALAAVDFSGRTGDREALDYIVRQKELNFAPGAEYLYSNSGYFLLSQIVKKASGKTLREFAAENIFTPLGMKDTFFLDDTTTVIPRRAIGYSPKRGGGFSIEMSGFEQTGDGAVQTTVEDFLLWDRNFYDARVLGQQGLQWMQTPGVLNDGKTITYAFGLVVSKYKGLPLIEHGGAWAGYRAHYSRFPEQKFSVVALCNAANANPTRRAHDVAEVYLGGLMANAAAPGTPPPVAKPAYAATPEERAAWKKYAGIYRNVKAGSVLRIVLENDKIFVRPGTRSFEIVPAGPAEFTLAQGDGDFRVRFEPAGAAGKLRMVQLSADGNTAFDSVEAFTPDAQQQRAFVGAYYSDEADVTYTIFQKEGKLHLRIGKWTEMPIEPIFRDAFAIRGGQMIFTRGANGRVTSFNVQAGRVRNILFKRVS